MPNPKAEPLIVETRYRDIPFEQMKKCCPTGSMTRSAWEKKWRGRPVTIHVPAVKGNAKKFVCSGPYFVATRPSKIPNCRVVVCPHIAEIGD